MKGKGRTGIQPPGAMNRTEAAYADVLQARLVAGEIIRWDFERITFTLSHSRPGVKGQRYTPDFMVMLLDGEIEFHEIKGFRDEKNMNKVKVAGEMFPFQFLLVTKRLKRDGGGFEVQPY
jgi:hypothetical protein